MPNIFESLSSFQPPRNAFMVRAERIKREGSPYYTWQYPATAAGLVASIHVPTQFPFARKYEPLDWLEIVNNEAANNLTLQINGGDSFPVPAGTIRTISGKALWSLAITNNGGGVTTLGLVIVTVRREAQTIDKWARRQQ